MGISVRNTAKTSVKAEPNVIPMIDIMLVLLIIFMIVTPLISSGFQATMPAGTNLDSDPEGENEVILGIDEAGAFYINGQAIPEAALEDQLRAIYGAREEDKILYFRADQNLRFGRIQDGVEIARRAGVAVMAAVTDLKQEGSLFGGGKEP